MPILKSITGVFARREPVPVQKIGDLLSEAIKKLKVEQTLIALEPLKV